MALTVIRPNLKTLCAESFCTDQQQEQIPVTKLMANVLKPYVYLDFQKLTPEIELTATAHGHSSVTFYSSQHQKSWPRI